MKKLFYYLIIRLTTRHAETAIKIYEKIYNHQPQGSIIEPIARPVVNEPKHSTNNKQQLIESLSYLKSKKVKTKQYKDSIYTLEMVLKNM